MRRGLSLIEVVVAVTVLSGALFTLGIVIPRSAMHLRNKGYETAATQMAEQVLDATRGLDPAQVPSGRWLTSPGSRDKQGFHEAPVHASGRRQFPPAPFPSDGKSAVLRRFELNVDANALDRFVMTGDADPAQQVPFFLDVEVEAARPHAPRAVVVTVWWRETSGAPDDDDAAHFRRFTLVSQVGM